ncbi:MAG TPA: DUF3710 domain-containing protein [Nocardioidaceae bacterium]|jgi:hypothetical protein|nr:DUF3710 domain-containing protein [Nocardioidaceae bacterium]
MFRRRKSESEAASEEADLTPDETVDAGGESAAASPGERRTGPWDVAEVSLDPEDTSLIDLGGLIVRGRQDIQLQLQVDEGSGQIVAVLMMAEEGAVELRPFAAPRSAGIWDDVRRQIAAETARLGGTATEADGAFGKELHVLVPVQGPEGQQLTQPSRVLGIAGPRWLLRATLLGKPAVEPEPDGVIESALRDVVVVRGSEAMAPGDPLPLRLPEGAQPMAPPE